MRIAASPVQQASLIRQAIWWRGDGHLAFNWNASVARYGNGRGDDRASRDDLGKSGRSDLRTTLSRHCLRQTRSLCARERKRRSNPCLRRSPINGLLRRVCHRAALRADPLARNDGVARDVPVSVMMPLPSRSRPTPAAAPRRPWRTASALRGSNWRRQRAALPAGRPAPG